MQYLAPFQQLVQILTIYLRRQYQHLHSNTDNKDSTKNVDAVFTNQLEIELYISANQKFKVSAEIKNLRQILFSLKRKMLCLALSEISSMAQDVISSSFHLVICKFVLFC